ncbi:MAG: futalosine hydrolase [Deferribacteres bacterium]|nr:futalosine hydrolase [Deferribacteres bacterium]
MRTLLLSPTLKEAERLIKALKLKEQKSTPFLLFESHRTVLAITGVGKVNAAVVSYHILSKGRWKEIILFGIGGSYSRLEADIGEVIAATCEIYGDEGVCHEKGFEPLGYVKDRMEMKPPPTPLKMGDFITLSCIPGSIKLAERIKKRFPSALCENMEGAAVAHVASIFNTKITEIRAISNIAGERDKKRWEIEKAVENLTRKLVEILEEGGMP